MRAAPLFAPGLQSRSERCSIRNHQMRGTVTLLFTDLVGSTELLAQLGDEQMQAVRRRHFALLGEAVAAHGGQVVKSLGDGIMATFSSASDAVGCAVVIQRGVARACWSRKRSGRDITASRTRWYARRCSRSRARRGACGTVQPDGRRPCARGHRVGGGGRALRARPERPRTGWHTRRAATQRAGVRPPRSAVLGTSSLLCRHAHPFSESRGHRAPPGGSNTAGAQQWLRAAHRLFTEMGAVGHAERLAQDLGT